MTRRWFITGGTPGGFGVAFAEAALESGDRVVLTSRRPQELASWAEQYGDRALVVPLDVTDAAQVQAAVKAAAEHMGGIDVLVNNAGRGWFGSIEAMDESSVRGMFELNFFAVLSVVRAVLPGMRARGNGWIVNVSSVAGLVAAPGFGYYSATKFAVEAVTDTLRDEVAGQGISVLTVEPGAFRTNAYAGFADESVAEPIPEYHAMLEEVRDTFVEMNGVQPGDPRRGARAVIAAMEQDTPPRRLVLGNGGFDAVIDTLERNLADVRVSESLSRGADFPA
ncbi:short-chain dehydrogenase/reductase SDR [Mycobacteroides abscessus subsp. massiliense]|uniref:SDR family NAD(P)-dependent oxidoreductase n=1 Tax=Mycobacteroides abscessus TaxID=36809 RepID=UPI0009A75D0C|nr:SDR family NAD(P)-dependent oxidoreductase [Mycobacteroides abscessus]SKD39577.1 short-chain dehydrogenase/reductase SDR [Mycobacteroides abscessus subsp. massiliense]SKD90465.1 short-chain dehydrogenase/reductase SDR [Mycobacteroides abscessus subsp. massiliense]SKE03042.1 short-chain dehydrogenase/reductase SDR [Mycobacteroides abscessus subsp. massiliense]SKE07099.1 short-chain dehydrogenase/reductase SDR [Mycobacteroides abscessus subsp. massiliense]SKE21498.1 short-chain dehydrogenase/